ncbi:MAG TPA: cytidine deaminase [Chthonomonadaceae bacterium]|nr:cytidine deaminase [Chthonomonadaceae bacterium]
MSIHTVEKALSHLNVSNDELLTIARKAARRAYCPYSRFAVGAAVLASDGHIYEGCNIENGSYGLSICAERVAIFSAVAAGNTTISRIAVSCISGNLALPNTLMPCGACRQVMKEFFDANSTVIVDRAGVYTLDDLLPHGFSLDGL